MVQLYIYDEVSSVLRPILVLRAFGRVHLVAGEKTTVTFRLTPDGLAFRDANMARTVEPGMFAISAGRSRRRRSR